MNDYDNVFIQGQQQLNSGRYREAEQTFREAIRLDPEDAAPHSNLGYLYMLFKQWDDARNEFMVATKLNPAKEYNFLCLAQCYDHIGRGTVYAQALEGNAFPNHAGSREVTLGLLDFKRGEYQQALLHFRAADQWYPNTAILPQNIGRSLMRLRRTAEARDIFDRALQTQRDSATLFYYLGLAEWKLRHRAAALRAFQTAVEFAPNELPAFYALLRAELLLGHWRSWARHFHQAWKLEMRKSEQEKIAKQKRVSQPTKA